MADAPLILDTDTLELSFPKLNQSITNANEAKNMTVVTETKANQALTNSQSTQTQLNTIVINGDSSVEAAQARVPASGTPFNTLKERLDASDAQLSDIAHILRPGEVLQSIINNAPDGSTIIFPKGTYNISQLDIIGKTLLKLCGYGAKLVGTDPNADAIINITNCNYIKIEDLSFSYSTKPMTYVAGKASCIKAYDYSFVKVENCKFDDFSNFAIWADQAKDDNGLTGGTTSTPIKIIDCEFTNQTITSDAGDFASPVYLGANAEYATIRDNEFRKCHIAIRGYGANGVVENNTIMSCTASFSPNRALIYFGATGTGDGVNSAKVIIENNKLNHNTGGVTAIYCVGDRTRGERRFTIRSNNILISGNTGSYGIGLKNADGSSLTDNYIKLQSGSRANILLDDCTDVVISHNELSTVDGIRAINNSTFKESDNVFIDLNSGKTPILLESGSKVLRESYLFRFNGSSGTLSGETTIPGVTFTKNGTGNYTITHNFGDINYLVSAIADNITTPIIVTAVRAINTLTIYAFNTSGVAVDASVMGRVEFRPTYL